MKREKTLLGALALMAAGFLFAAPAAQAQTPLDTISNGGVTCKQYATTYVHILAENGHQISSNLAGDSHRKWPLANPLG